MCHNWPRMRSNADLYYQCQCGLILEWTLDEVVAVDSIVECPNCGQKYALQEKDADKHE